MALSLVCRQCNTFLRSVKEAQEHGEVTGHCQFEESTEPGKYPIVLLIPLRACPESSGDYPNCYLVDQRNTGPLT
jgi:hypothetical protein